MRSISVNKEKIDEDYEPTKEEIAEQERIKKALAILDHEFSAR